MRTNNALIQVARSTILQFSRRFVAHCQPGAENPADCIWADLPCRRGLPAVAGAPRDRDIKCSTACGLAGSGLCTARPAATGYSIELNAGIGLQNIRA
jgi:hypothetical protein